MNGYLGMEISLRRVDDLHVHLRQGELLKAVARETSRVCGRCLVMPNTTPPVVTAGDVLAYRREVADALGPGCEPLMTIKILPTTTPDVILAAKEAGAVAGKVYPCGITTNSEDGIPRESLETEPPFGFSGSLYQEREWVNPDRNFLDCLAAMEQCGMVLCVHGEMPGFPVLNRELGFLGTVALILCEFPRLKVVWEHVTTGFVADRIGNWYEQTGGRIAATITAHHLLITMDDVVGDFLRPHLFCKPFAKLEADRKTLVYWATSGHPAYAMGSDSAPHERYRKENDCGCAGIFSAPVLIESLAEVFEAEGKLDRLQAFTSERGADFYGLPRNAGTITLERRDWTVPDEIGGVVPLWAGRVARWRVADGEANS
jgi:dihydroorotase